MKTNRSIGFAIAVAFLWIGFVCAISFMEAWLKFRAPGITLSLGLGIGRIVFAALNKVEWFLAVASVVILILHTSRFKSWMTLLILAILILFLQTIWLLPALDLRAEWHLSGIDVPPSRLHLIYILVEFLKVLALTGYGITLINRSRK